MSVRILVGDVKARLHDLDADSIDCVVTSPPYWGLRSYLPADHADKVFEIGLEPTLGQHIDALVEVFEEIKRVVKPNAAVWLNYGDCYATTPNGRSAADTKAAGNDDRTFRDKPFSTIGPVYVSDPRTPDRRGNCSTLRGAAPPDTPGRIAAGGYLKPKDLCLIPFRLVIALQEAGWYVRSRCVWGKPQPMPDSSGKWRPSVAHEEIFLLSKSGNLYYDAEAVCAPASTATNSRVPKRIKMPAGWDTGAGGHGSFHRQGREKGKTRKQDEVGGRHYAGFNDRWKNSAGATPKSAAEDTNIKAKASFNASMTKVMDTRFLRTYEPQVWHIATAAFSEAHYACVDADTEALTPDGWRDHEDLQDGDLIAAYDQPSGVLSWQPATFHRYAFNGELVAIEKRGVSQRITPNHRCLVKRRVGGVGVVEARELKPGMQIPTTAPLHVDEIAGPGADFAALLGWYVTEGEKRRHHIIRINQSHAANPSKVVAIRQTLERLDADFSEAQRKREWRGRPADMTVFSVRGEIAERLHSYSPGKEISLAWVAWPRADIEALLNAIIDGDGHRRRDDGRCNVIQKDRGFVDAVQILGLRLGKNIAVSPRKDGGFAAYMTDGSWLTLRSANGQHIPLGTVEYEGIVWCPSVLGGFWLARRRGRTFITGNTFPPALVERCLKASCPPGGVVCDPFGGAGTVGMVADGMGYDAVLIELSEEYAEIARRRIADVFRPVWVEKTAAVQLPLFSAIGAAE